MMLADCYEAYYWRDRGPIAITDLPSVFLKHLRCAHNAIPQNILRYMFRRNSAWKTERRKDALTNPQMTDTFEGVLVDLYMDRYSAETRYTVIHWLWVRITSHFDMDTNFGPAPLEEKCGFKEDKPLLKGYYKHIGAPKEKALNLAGVSNNTNK